MTAPDVQEADVPASRLAAPCACYINPRYGYEAMQKAVILRSKT